MAELKNGRDLSLLLSTFVFWLGTLTLFGAVLTQSGGMTDFRSYYAAGELARHSPQRLYSAAAQMGAQAAVGSGSFYPWAHLPAEALLMAPLTWLPFGLAFLAWKIVNLALLLIAVYALRSYVRGYSALALIVCPVAIGLGAGQDHILLLLIFVLGFLSLKQGREFRAGGILGLGLIRFGVAAPLLLFFLAARRWRVLWGAAVAALLLLATGYLVVGRTFAPQYIAICKLLASFHNSPDTARMPTIRGFVTAVFPHSTHAYLAVIALSAALLIWGFRRWVRWNGDPACIDVLFSVALILSLLVDYHGYIYTMTSLLIPALVLVKRNRKASLVLWICAALMLATWFRRPAALGYLFRYLWGLPCGSCGNPILLPCLAALRPPFAPGLYTKLATDEPSAACADEKIEGMLQLSAAGKRFGQKLLFEDVNWLITPDERTGLVGGNGTGKSTLLKILAGMETLDYGELTRVKGMTLGYLPQDGLALRGKTVFQECLSVFDHLRELEREAEEITHTLSTADPKSREYTAAADRYSDIADHLHVHDIYTLDAQVGAVLGGLGFSKEDWERKTEEFSGGWQMRIALAKLLLQKPSLLLLDEPTNHLDLESRNWLEAYLHDYPNAYILISHDRYFLDVTVNKVVELWNKRMHVYHGNYEKYVTQKDERRTTLMAAYKNQRDRIEQLEAFINRFRYQATKAKQVQSRIKELEKIERIEVPEEEATIHFTIPQPPASGRTVIEVANLYKDYPMPEVDGKPGGVKHVLEDISFQIDRGDRIALVGANGAGKSTLIRLLSNLEPPTAGTVRYGHNVLADYFAQDQYKVLDPDAVMLDDMAAIAPKVPVVELRSLLGCFMFSGDDVFKKLGVLSGGERNRYAMAKMLVSPANMLLLDEPTNHLDLRAKDVLLEAIANFTGTVLFVSHDRYFIDGLATRVFEVEDRRVHIYPGGYEDYLWRKQGGPAQVAASLAADIKPVPAAMPEPVAPPAAVEKDPRSTPTAHAKRLNPIKQKQLEDRVAVIEQELGEVDTRVAAAEERLGHYVSAEESQRTAAELEELRAKRGALTDEWESLATQLEEHAAAV